MRYALPSPLVFDKNVERLIILLTYVLERYELAIIKQVVLHCLLTKLIVKSVVNSLTLD